MSSDTDNFKPPLIYLEGYREASATNPEVAAAYIRNTVVDDPLADRAIETLGSMSGQQVNRVMNACMACNAEILSDAPPALQAFFEPLNTIPPWFDCDAALPGRIVFYEHLSLFITGFIIVSLKNFNSLMARIFFMTGQGTTQQGLQVIRQNIRYLVETLLLPDALRPGGRGWKFSIRIRLVHARIRRQLRASSQWNEADLGAPISAANMALASANFSVALIRYVEHLGAVLDADARSSLMQIWRYASWLIGTPEALLYEGHEADTAELSRIGHMCEPRPDKVSVLIANATVQALPELAALKEPSARQKLTEHGYQIARVLLGDVLADQYEFPQFKETGFLMRMRRDYHLNRNRQAKVPRVAQRFDNFPFISLLEAVGLVDIQHELPQEFQAMIRKRNSEDG